MGSWLLLKECYVFCFSQKLWGKLQMSDLAEVNQKPTMWDIASTLRSRGVKEKLINTEMIHTKY